MKRPLFTFLVLVLVLIVVLEGCRRRKDQQGFVPVTSESFAKDPRAEPLFKQNELLIFFKDQPTAELRARLREAIRKNNVSDSIKVRTCNSCGGYAELWSATGIHNVISGEGVYAGTGGGGTKGVGEDSDVSLSLNFLISPPVDERDLLSGKDVLSQGGRDLRLDLNPNRDTIVVAVLDTGIDTTRLIDPRVLWTNPGEKSGTDDADGNCYDGDRKGWNFLANSPDITEDHPNLHGTLVTKYIIDAMKNDPRNFVQIMPLKTHDNTGYGDLFSTICALHYAIDKGANIINASWGFYFYDKIPHPYLSDLITNVMKDKGILFVTAAGNKMEDADNYAKQLYFETNGTNIPDSLLRNLSYHRFYPATLSGSKNNVVAVTTNDKENVSPTQNYYSDFVNIGVMADTVSPTSMKFRLPFPNATGYISGSSFATAILTGAVAAHVPADQFAPGIDKSAILDWLETNSSSDVIPLTVTRGPVLESKKRIEFGRYLGR